jgi:threonyl-tRNA synthetase
MTVFYISFLIMCIAMSKEPIEIILPNGNKKQGISFVTTPLDIAKELSNSLPEKVVVAKVRYLRRVATLDEGLFDPQELNANTEEAGWILYDSFRPLEGDCELKLLTFDDAEGRMVFWHSSAHILGEALERDFGVHLCHGPPTTEGFFYDCHCGSDVQ